MVFLKMHDVLVHSVPFAKRWKTRGLLNEQSWEAIHRVMHRDEKDFAQFKKQESRKALAQVKHQNVLALIDKD